MWQLRNKQIILEYGDYQALVYKDSESISATITGSIQHDIDPCHTLSQAQLNLNWLGHSLSQVLVGLEDRFEKCSECGRLNFAMTADGKCWLGCDKVGHNPENTNWTQNGEFIERHWGHCHALITPREYCHGFISALTVHRVCGFNSIEEAQAYVDKIIPYYEEARVTWLKSIGVDPYPSKLYLMYEDGGSCLERVGPFRWQSERRKFYESLKEKLGDGVKILYLDINGPDINTEDPCFIFQGVMG